MPSALSRDMTLRSIQQRLPVDRYSALDNHRDRLQVADVRQRIGLEYQDVCEPARPDRSDLRPPECFGEVGGRGRQGLARLEPYPDQQFELGVQ